MAKHGGISGLYLLLAQRNKQSHTEGAAEAGVPEEKNPPGSLLRSPEGGGSALRGKSLGPLESCVVKEVAVCHQEGQDPTPQRCEGPC